jgi:hypothetical protein
METGQRGATLRDIRDLCSLYSVTDAELRSQLTNLAAEGKKQGWWQDFDRSFPTYINLENEASSIRSFDSALVPELLQTADYVRAVHERTLPAPSDDRVEEFAKLTGTRQQILTAGNLESFEVIIDDAVLHRLVGGTGVMVAQIKKIIEYSSYPNISLRVVPYGIGAHPAVGSNFRIMDFPGQAPSVVHVDGLVGSIYLEQRTDLERYDEIFQALRAVALSPGESLKMLTEEHQSVT